MSSDIVIGSGFRGVNYHLCFVSVKLQSLAVTGGVVDSSVTGSCGFGRG